MATEFDNQLIESVTVRRNRLADSLLFGDNPTERRWKGTARLFLYSIVVAALIAAICVAVAFVGNLLSQQQEQQRQRQQGGAAPAHVRLVPTHAADAGTPLDGAGGRTTADHLDRTGD